MDERNEDYDTTEVLLVYMINSWTNVPYKEWGKYLKSLLEEQGYFRRAYAGAWMRHRKSDGDFSRLPDTT